MKRKLLPALLALTMSVSLTATPYFLIDSKQEWRDILIPMSDENFIHPATENDWIDFMNQRNMYLLEGELPPPSMFLPPDLYVFPGDPADPAVPDNAGLIMAWGDPSLPEDKDYTSGYIFQYGVDPDLRNCTIKLSVHPPAAITMVAFGLTDVSGNQCSWTWFVPANIPPSPPGPAATITINTNNVPAMGLNSANPPAASFSCSPAFDMSQVISIFINETFHNTPGVFPPPPPGGGTQYFYWNAWDNIVITPNNGGGTGQAYTKSHVKYSQPPVTLDEDPGLIVGWDELSVLTNGQIIMADDWQCKDDRPVTDIHWWGSFLGWTQPTPPRGQLPRAFHIGIWTDIPVGDEIPWSRPGELIWENVCDSYVWNFAGYDLDPRCDDPDSPCEKNEACFQFNQLLSQDEWFRQLPLENPDIPNVYWLSIAAIYEPGQEIVHPWGWKTREHLFNDDAVRIFQIVNPDGTNWPGTRPVIGAKFVDGQPVEFPPERSWDLAFELTTNQQAPCHALPADLNHDCIVNMPDLALFAQQWLAVE